MARVYLAVQKQFGRLVALKVVSAQYATDDNFRKRFLQESQINARLTHPNIVQVYDVGAHEAYLYLVLEYIRGGDLNQRLDRGMQLRSLVGVIKDIGRALDYAHSRGFVHRDIKPENILFREDDSAVLTDFGIARLVDPKPTITRAGTVVGTPQYMSPEQVSGKELDGRSDLYSLGVVFYRVLTGDVPFKADTAVSIGIKHLQEPVPRLPNYLNAFQGVIDRSLAKKLEQRYQSGEELGRALDNISQAATLPNATIRSNVVTTQEIRAVGQNVLTTVRDPARADLHSRRHRKRRFGRLTLYALLLLMVVGAGSYVVVEQPQLISQALQVAGMAENPEVQETWSAAQSLHQDPNQSLGSIVASYRRVLNLDANHLGAADAVAGLASQWENAVLEALEQENLELAETKLAESMAAFPDDPVWSDLSEQVDDHRHAEQLLSSTQALLRSHGLSDIPSASAAIQAYQEVLRLAPGHSVASQELDALAEHYANLAASAADQGQVDEAINFLDRASAANATYPELDGVRGKIQQATTIRATIDDLLQQASAYRAAGALVNPVGENAAEFYHRVLAIRPDDVIAAQGLDEIVSQLRARLAALLQDRDVQAAIAVVDRAGGVGLDSVAVNDMRASVEQEILRRDTVAEHLGKARELFAQGFITQPQNDNVVAMLREVDRLDPGNQAAQRMLSRSAQRLAEAAQEAYAAGLADDAKYYLELALTVTPGVDAWRKLRLNWENSISNN